MAIAFGAEDQSGSTLVLLRAGGPTNSAWATREWSLSTPVAYASIAADEDRLAIAFVRGGDPPTAEANALFVINSSDGRSWTEAKQASGPDQQPAIEPHIFLRDTVIDVIWMAQPDGGFTKGRVWSAALGLDGSDISERSVLPLEGVTNWSTAAQDACGAIHFAVRQYTPAAGTRIAYARHGSAGWTEISFLAGVGSATQPSIASTSEGFRLIWSSVRESPTELPTAALMSATLSVRAW
jgi:hypothetical protein